ncbi:MULTISPECIES: phage holin family protein [unclassified Serratia (in: enterobacteria)]|uniref:phage holin family protein n=1 Tax=unclassified Serratia (in: enterobacteria) TaxID=2647522 RepID=UPI0008FEEA12|nr:MULTISPECIES: phage holin family protein [unclassified Serratia (in: enterobacteria)]
MNEYLLTINAIAYGATAFRLMACRRNGATYRPMVTVFAWLLIVVSASVTIRTLTGDYHVANWSETLINVASCIAVVWGPYGYPLLKRLTAVTQERALQERREHLSRPMVRY